MLLEFSVKNFRSFKEKATLNMIDENGDILNTAVFMGANSSGKTNFFKAMFIARLFIKSGIIDAGTINICDTYLNNENPVQYTFLFKQDDLFIKYFFSVIKNRGNVEVDKEKLEIGDTVEDLKEIYYREMSEIKILCQNDKKLCEKISGVYTLFNSIGNLENILFLKNIIEAINITDPNIEPIKLFFETLDIADIDVFASQKNIPTSLDYIFLKLQDANWKRGFVYFLQIADPTVKDIKAESKGVYKVVHELEKGDIEIDFNEESGGIRVFSSLFRIVDAMLRENKIWIVDELDCRLHYDLLSMIVELIDENKISSQIIFTCHNIGAWHWDIKNNCFHIVEKIDGASSIKRVLENVGNKDKRIEKYMGGGLGGFPPYEYSEKALNNYIDNLGDK